jgi:methionine sulfoxide reductase catalytic subunit
LSARDTPNTQKDITHYNNFYEFGTGKDEPVINAMNFKPSSPWKIEVTGEIEKPVTIDLDRLVKLAPLEERITRHRCVEGWSMVIPWIGLPLSALLKQVNPKSSARYVAFESHYDGRIMLNSRQAHIPFPYREGLRMDEAMHPLTILAVGLYGETLPNQCGAPVRLVVPWKYGFKHVKSIARMELTAKEPPTTWNIVWPEAYGFYANVNPNVPHPGHSQAKETRLPYSNIRTQMFNGYVDQVASLYQGMDLRRQY